MARTPLLPGDFGPGDPAAAPRGYPTGGPDLPLSDPPRRRPQSNAGKFHLGGYYDHDNPIVRGLRRLVADTHMRQQDLLEEAITDLLKKYEANTAFGG